MLNWKIEELLNILNSTEATQKIWLACQNLIQTSEDEEGQVVLEESFADLAFRLRDEVVEQNLTMWQRAMDTVFLKANEEHWKEKHPFERWTAVLFWFNHKAKPIHWIIACLIAKEIETNPEEKVDDQDEIREIKYGIAQDKGNGVFGFWHGPSPSLTKMLEEEGQDEKSVIFRLYANNTNDLIYRWIGDEWMKVNE